MKESKTMGFAFHAGHELGTTDATEFMRARYCVLVGILGEFNVGKTCLLSSLYLKAALGDLGPSYAFAGSYTLPGFEARARKLRNWEGGQLPDQLVDHTRLVDRRKPAFMHMALMERGEEGERLEFLFTDLPGEWSKNLIERAATSSRFDFLQRADGIVVVIDGPLLAGLQTRHVHLRRSKLLLTRLAETVCIDRNTPLILVVSKCDKLDMKSPNGIEEINEHAKSLGFSPDVILTAAFSAHPEKVESGTGVMEILETIILRGSLAFSEPQSPSRLKGSRMFQCFQT